MRLWLTPSSNLPAGLPLRLAARQHRPEQEELQQQQAAAIAEAQRQQEQAEERRRRLPSRDAGFSLLLDEEEEVFWEPAGPADGSSSLGAGSSRDGASRPSGQPRRSHKENVGRRELAFRAADQHDIAVSVACAGAQPLFREEERLVLTGLVQQRINDYASAACPVHPCSGEGTVTLKVCGALHCKLYFIIAIMFLARADARHCGAGWMLCSGHGERQPTRVGPATPAYAVDLLPQFQMNAICCSTGPPPGAPLHPDGKQLRLGAAVQLQPLRRL